MNRHHLRTILWLRWRLSQNQWNRAGALNAVLSVLAVVFSMALAVGGFISGFCGAWWGLAKASPEVTLLVCDVVTCLFLFFWALGIVTEIQRSESIDITRLMHLPIALKEVFLLNYLASHVTLSIIVFVPAMLGLTMGLAFATSFSRMILLLLVLGFVFMITAWTYCLRGWLVALMVNPRRRRAIIVGVTTVFILLGQLPSFYFTIVQDRSRTDSGKTPSAQSKSDPSTGGVRNHTQQLPSGFLAAHHYLPPLWIGNGAMALAQGDAWPAIWSSVGTFIIGAFGLRRAYQATLRFYHGQPSGRPPKKPREAKATQRRAANFLEKELSAVPQEATAMALASFRSMTRAPEVKMAFSTSFVMLLVFGAMLFARGSQAPSEQAKPYIATGAVVFVMFGLLQLMFNQFGFDRDGFRALVLLPTRRKAILLGKNLAFAPMMFGAGLVLLVALKVIVHVAWVTILATLLQLIATFLLGCIAGNFVSIIAPYRIAAGSLKPTKIPVKTAVLIFLSHLLFPVAMIPIFVPAGLESLFGILNWLAFLPVNLVVSLVLMAVVVFFYRLSLDWLGELLQRREKDILRVVTQEVE